VEDGGPGCEKEAELCRSALPGANRDVCGLGGIDAGFAAATAAIAVDQPAELHVEHRRLVERPFVMPVATQGIAAVLFAGLGSLER